MNKERELLLDRAERIAEISAKVAEIEKRRDTLIKLKHSDDISLHVYVPNGEREEFYTMRGRFSDMEKEATRAMCDVMIRCIDSEIDELAEELSELLG